jgi:putative membrane protein
MDGWWWVMAPLMVVFWGLVIWGVVVLFRRVDRGSSASADDVLAERFARGDISEEDYRRQRDLLRS